MSEIKCSVDSGNIEPLPGRWWWKNSDKIRYLITFYVDIGQLPVDRVKPYIEKLMNSYLGIWEALPSGYGIMVVPRRGESTTIEYMDLLNGDQSQLSDFIVK